MLPPGFLPLARKPKNENLFALDTPAPIAINPSESYLKGWFIPSPPRHETTLGVSIEGSFTPALYGLPRPDVASHFNDPSLTDCGFYVRFRSPQHGRPVKVVNRSKLGVTVLAEVAAAPALSEAALFWPEAEVSARLSTLSYRPLISVILPTHNPDLFLLEHCVQSVHKQQYPHWQLCMSAKGAPARCHTAQDVALPLGGAPDSAPVLREFLQIGADAPGRAEAQNQALQRAEGDFIVTLDQSDELHPCALLEIVKRLNESANCEMLYSDEDDIDRYGLRTNPSPKPDFDPDMFLAFDYVGRLVALKRSSVLALGGWRAECEGAHDWDLHIRLMEQAAPKAVQHIAKPIYHRGAREEHRKALERVLSDHVQRTGKQAAVEPGVFPGSMRLKYAAPRTAAIAVFIRPEDGDFQLQTVRACANRGRDISIYLSLDCAVRPADVCVFINRPLETLNHSFFEELAAQALREECGLVTGLSVPSALDVIKVVETIPADFFAVRREHLAAVGGVSSMQMPELVRKLVTHAHQRGLRVIVTPFAVASFHSVEPAHPPDNPEGESRVPIDKEQPRPWLLTRRLRTLLKGTKRGF